MKNKQKMWRRPEVQKAYRKAAVAAAETMAEKVTDPKAKRGFLEQAVNLLRIRIGRMVKMHFQTMPKLT